MLGTDGDFEDWRGVRSSEGEVMRHLLGVVQFVGYVDAVYDCDFGILGVGFVDQGDSGLYCTLALRIVPLADSVVCKDVEEVIESCRSRREDEVGWRECSYFVIGRCHVCRGTD